MYSSRLGRSLVAALLAAICSVAFVGTASANKCTAGKVKCVVNKTKALLGCHGKAAGKGLVVDPACVQKAKDKFDGGADPAKGCFEKLEAKGEKPGAKPALVCQTSNDTDALEAKVDAFVADLVAEVDTAVDANKCAAGKAKCATTKTAALLGCHGKAIGKDLSVDPACLQKAKGKFDGGADPAKGCFEKLEAKGEKSGAKPALICPTSDDTDAIEAKIDAFVADIVATLASGPVPTPTATATPVPTATACGAPGACGNCTIDAGEFCDPPAVGACGAGLTCTGCNCACPTKVHFAGDATAPESILDSGWQGIAHRAPIITNGDVTVSLNCVATERPCGTCNITGPIANLKKGNGELDNQRCINDTAVRCTNNTDCNGVGGNCEFIFGSALPLAAGGVTTCVFNQFNGQVTGTANVETGEANTVANLTSRVYTGLTIDNPCARCIGDGAINDGVQGGTCSGGVHNGDACDGNGTVPNRPDFGVTSLDCPLAAGSLIATLPIDLSNATDPVTKTLDANSPTCAGEAGERCLCDTCNNLAATPCDSNADCVAVGATQCGGRRCIGGTQAGVPCPAAFSVCAGGANTGATCTTNSQCPGSTCALCPSGGICGRPGEPTKPSACLDDTSTVGVIDCNDTAPVDGEGECVKGPITQSCSVASGHAQRGCTSDGDCGGSVGSCESNNRQCFLTGGFSGKNGTNTLVANGMEDPPVADVSHPTLGAVFCIGPTGSSSVNNVAGLPGPGRVTIKGTAEGLP